MEGCGLGRIVVASKVFDLTPNGTVGVCGQYNIICIHNNALLLLGLEWEGGYHDCTGAFTDLILLRRAMDW